MLKYFKKITFRVVGVVNIISILAMLITGYSDRINPTDHPIATILGLLFPAFIILNVGFLIFWIFFHWRGAWMPILGFILCYSPIRIYAPFNLQSTPPEGSIKILSYNVLMFAPWDVPVGEVNPIMKYICESKADIVCLQEASPHELDSKRDSMIQKVYAYKDSTQKAKSNCLVLYSKYPILSKEIIQYESRSNLSVAYLLKVKGEKVLVINNHFESIGFSPDEKQEFKSIVKGDIKEDSARSESRRLLTKLSDAAKKRAPEAEAVAAYIKKYRDKGIGVIVCGDFNDSPISYTRHTVAAGLTDCYVSSGRGPGFSYNNNRMYVRIDHILCSDEWEPYNAVVDSKIGQSDHYPISCWLKKCPKP